MTYICPLTNMLHILLDMIHFYRSRCTIEDLVACKKERFSLVHLCDAPAAIPDTRDQLISTCRKERLYPGEGAIPIEAILSELTDAEVFSVEIPNAARKSSALSVMRPAPTRP